MWWAERSRRAALALVLAGALAGCGFHLRGATPLPFESLYVGVPESSEFGASLRRSIAANGTRVAAAPEDAQARLTVLGEEREKSILTLNAAGRVREFQLKLTFGFHVHDGKGREFVAPARIVMTRDITFDDSNVLAKETEEALLYRDMQNDLVQQVMRRLAAARLASQ